MEPKKSNKSTYIVAGAIAYLIILLLSCHMGMYATGHPSSDLLTILGHGFTRMFEKPFDIFPIPGKAFAYIGILTVLSAFLLLAFIVNQEKNRVDMLLRFSLWSSHQNEDLNIFIIPLIFPLPI